MKNCKKVVACLLFATLMVMGAMLFTSCDEDDCNHVWADATCTEPKTCILCEATEGEALGHTGGAPTCTSLGVCTRCTENYGELSAHTPAEDDGDCTTPVLCKGCDKVMTEAQLAHTPAEDDGDCSTAVPCTVCGGVVTPAKTHLFGSDCDTDCNNIGCTHTRVVTHSYTVELPADEFIKTPATCKAAAVYYKSCVCGAKGADSFTYGSPLAHTPKAPQQENIVNPTCGAPGSYNEVVRCLDCNDVIGTERKTIPATGNHTPGTPVRENEVGATCGEDGSYDEVVYCTVCQNKVSTTQKSIPATGVHTPKTPVEEGRVEPTCGVPGSYNEVTYCRDCNHKISTVLKTIPATGAHTPAEDDGDCTTAIGCTVCGRVAIEGNTAHTPGTAVKEKEVAATCGKAGSYESAVYCEVCHKEISRTTVTVIATGNHTAGEAVKEKETAPTCGVAGSYESVVYCSVCDEELSRDTITVSATGNHTPGEDDGDCTTPVNCTVCGQIATPAKDAHTPGEAVKEEIVAPGCGTDGSYKNVIYCAECGKKISSETVTDPATGAHTESEAVKEKEKAENCGEAGSYDSVVYCSVCGDEISRETVIVPPTGEHIPDEDDDNCLTDVLCTVCGGVAIPGKAEHTPAEAVKENEQLPSCNTAGHYDLVVRCEDCHMLISLEHKDVPATGAHADGTPVEESRTEPTCDKAGSRVLVTYCTVCGNETARTTEAIPATGNHTPGEDDGDCTTDILCTECGQVAVEGKEDHTPGEAVNETISLPTCGASGSHYEIVSCEDCGTEISRETVTDPATGAHVFDKEVEAVTYLKASATCESAAVYYKSCVCGHFDEEESETFTVGEAVDCAFTDEVVAPEYLKSEATCQSAAIYYKTCIWCHEKGGEGDVFKSGEPKEHTFTAEVVDPKYICTVANCKEAATYYKSCEDCGEAGEDTFSYGEKAACVFENELAEDRYLKEAATCESAAVYYKSCTGCGEQGGEGDIFTDGEPLSHSYTEEVADGRYLKSEADCYRAAIYYKSCECGHFDEEKSETFENGEAAGHSYDGGVVTEPTCTEDGYTTYRCTVCGEGEYTADEVKAKGHDIKEAELLREEQIENSCEYKQIWRCNTCGEEAEGKTATKHIYTATVTSPATCQEEGVMTYRCVCGENYTTAIPANEGAHNWVGVNGSTENFECDNEGCDATKTVVDKSTETEASVNKDSLADSSLQLKDAEIKLDADILGSEELKNATDLTIGANTMSKEELPEGVTLSEEQKNQIGDNPIYDFSMKNGETPISEFKDADGNPKTITITIPYTLTSDVNADSIFIWFINDNGEVEAIKATYNEVNGEGFVTFETSHFSYYSVTRLTEKEQCEFYKEHKETTITVEPTCTSGGYVLHICTRCGYTYKSDEVSALPHNYEKNAELSTPPTCKSFGYDRSVCSACGHTQTVTVPKLAHAYEESVVAPGCGMMGYTQYTCPDCGNIYRDSYVPALKHDYEITWNYNEEGDAATVTFTCKNDASHTETLEARVIFRNNPATCQKDGLIGTEASVYFGGKTYTDNRLEVIPALSHDYAYTLYDETNHWTACLCGAREEGTAQPHSFDSEQILSAATCQKMGEKLIACDCGFKKTETINTVDHVYVSGKCTMCGGIDGDCDHTPSKKETLDLGALGCCQDSLSYTTCDCGKVKVLDMNELLGFVCMNKGQPDSMEGSGTADDPMRVHYVCPDCGIELYMQGVMDMSGCRMYISYVMTLIMNGETVLENATAEQDVTDHSAQGLVTIDLSHHTACGGYLKLYQCGACGEYTNIYSINPGCTDKDPKQEMVIVDGVPHMIQMIECEIEGCGLTFLMDAWQEQISACEMYMYGLCEVRQNGELLYSATIKEYDSNHDWKYEYTIKNEALGCEGGIRGDGVCRNCGQTTWYETNGHETEKVFIDISEYGCCMQELTVQQCAVCKKITNVDIWSGGCNFTQVEYVENEQGSNTRYRCQNNCGLEYTAVGVVNPENSTGCAIYFDVTNTLAKNGTTIFSYVGHSIRSEHDWNNTYIYNDPENPNCENGYRCESVCKKCGETENSWGSGHRHEMFDESFAAEGTACGGIHINGAHCPVCGKVHYLNVNIHCPYTQHDSTYEDEAGRTHNVMLQTCERCGYALKTDRYVALADGCHIRRVIEYTITLNGETVYEATVMQDEYMHNYEYEYKLRGETCNDGYEYVATCTLCNDSYESWGSGHDYYHEKIELSELGTCGGYITKNACRICGETDPVGADVWLHCNLQPQGKPSTYTGEDGYLHTVEVLVCEKCGLIVTYDSYVTPRPDFGPCDVYAYRTTILEMNGEEVATVTRRQDEAHHKNAYRYEYFDEALGCLGGYNRVSFCEYCGWEWGGMEMYGHDYQTETVYLEEYGACRGELYIIRCHCGQLDEIKTGLTCQTWFEPHDYTDEYGRPHHDYEKSCATCGFLYRFESYTEAVKGSCKSVTYCTVTVTVDGAVVLVESYETESYDHSYTITGAVLAEGSKSCTDGVTLIYTCVCGESYESHNWHHETLPIATYDLSEYGSLCGSVLYEKACACGEERELSLDEECDYEHVGCDAFVSDYVKDYWRNEYIYNEYEKHLSHTYCQIPSYFYTLTCAADNCGSAVRYATYWVRDPETCMATEYILYQLGYNAEDGSYQKEVLMATGRVEKWHDYEMTQYENGERYDCACGSYVEVQHKWEGDIRTTTVILVNTRYSDVPARVQTVSTYDEHSEITKQVTTYTDGDGKRHTLLTEVTYGVYTPEIDLPALFDGCGLVLEKTTTTLDGVPFRQYYENAYLEYNGYRYNLMDYTEYYREDGTLESWYKALFEYRIGETCEYRHITSGSDREDHVDEYWQNCCHGYWNDTVKPTCTQDGVKEHVCIICKHVSAVQAISPDGHDFEYRKEYDDQVLVYFCTRCGLESATGVNGTVTFEDLSDESNYIIGYYVGENEHSYMPVVHVIVDGEAVEILNVPIGESTEIRAHVITRGAVEEAVNNLIADGKLAEGAEYDLRFQYLATDGEQHEFLYAITLTK